MLQVASALNGCNIEASDGGIGSVGDFLFDDATWKLRWLVVDTGGWLTGRKVLIHPSAIGKADYERRELPVSLTRAQVKASPDILEDQPVSQQIERHLYDYYGWDPLWSGGDYFEGGFGVFASPLSTPSLFGRTTVPDVAGFETDAPEGDPHLRSIAATNHYHIHATDGVIGHLENVLIEDADWSIRYLVIDTKNWWLGKHVLISPYAVREINWPDREIRLNVTRGQVKDSPAWDPAEIINQAFEKRLHAYYGWPGYRF